MNKMINEAMIREAVIRESCYEGNCDDEGNMDWEPEDFIDPEDAIEIIGGFWLKTKDANNYHRSIMRIRDNVILFWEMVSVLNTMDLEELAAEVESERDSCAEWNETHSYNFGGY